MRHAPSTGLLLATLLLASCGAGHQGSPAEIEEAQDVSAESRRVEAEPLAGTVELGPVSDDLSPRPIQSTGDDTGPFRVGGEVERPRPLDRIAPIDGLVAMMQSGEYAWGACIFEILISERGDVTDVRFLKPEDLAIEVREVIEDAARDWKFSPARRAGEAVAVFYYLVIHHCPYQRIDREPT